MSLSITVAKVIKIAEIQAKKTKKLLMIEKRKGKQIYLVYLNFRSEKEVIPIKKPLIYL
jgi:hypothetical protein